MRERIVITTTRRLDGGYECSTVYGGRLLRFVYMGYTKRECERMFREYVRAQVKP